MQVNVVLVYPYFIEVPIRIKFSHFLQFEPEIRTDALGQYLAAESGHPHDVILGLVYRMGLFV